MIPLAEIRRAREVIAEDAIRTPLVRLQSQNTLPEIFLKLENLQPIGSFKIRGATNAIRQAPKDEVASGVLTASAGNMAQGVAWAAHRAGVPCTVIVPENAPDTKLKATERLGAKSVRVPFERWWKTIQDSSFPGVEGLFIHPVENDRVMAGNGTIALEVLEELPEPDVVLVPWGGGGLACGIASVLRGLAPKVKVLAVEPETAAPLRASLAQGAIAEVDYRSSFIDGAGAKSLLPKMWLLAQNLVDGSLSVSLDDVAAAIRLLAERHRVIAEGAGALALAAALSGQAGSGRIVCIVSGGNLDFGALRKILDGETP